MGCGASTASKLPVQSNVPQAQHQMGDADGAGPPPQPPPPPGIHQNSIVIYEGAEYTVQYITSKGSCDLRSGTSGDVLYGVEKAMLQPLYVEPPHASSAAGVATPTCHSADNSTATGAAPAPAAPIGPALTLGESLAKPGGSGARVHKCRLEEVAPGEELAVKLLPRSARADQLEVLVAEAELCQSLHHESIVRFLHCASSISISGAAHCAIVMELLPVSLEDLIVRRAAAQAAAAQAAAAQPASAEGASSSSPPPLPPSSAPFGFAELSSVATQLAAALSYLHTGLGGPPLLHRDVKPGNIFFEAAAGDALDEELAGRRSAGEGLAPAGRLRLGDFDVGIRAESALTEFTGKAALSNRFLNSAPHGTSCIDTTWIDLLAHVLPVPTRLALP